jgi:hypothetical protein
MRPSIDTCFAVDVRPLLKLMRTASGSYRHGASSLDYSLDVVARRLTLVWSSGGQTFAYEVDLTATHPHLGGARCWARCPRCARRCAVLHVLGAGTLGCRVCLGLQYESTRETALDLARRRARAARSRVGASMDLFAPFAKPPRMHWRTFLHHAEKERAAIAEMLGCLERSADRLDKFASSVRGHANYQEPRETPPRSVATAMLLRFER